VRKASKDTLTINSVESAKLWSCEYVLNPSEWEYLCLEYIDQNDIGISNEKREFGAQNEFLDSLRGAQNAYEPR